MKITRMTVRIAFIEDLLGSAPADPDIYTRFVASKAPAEWQAGEEQGTLNGDRERGFTVFHQDSRGCFLYNYVLKGYLKEAGNVLKDADSIKVKNLRSKIDNYVFVQPRRLYLMRDGKVIQEPDEVLERPLRGMTMKGPRVSLASSELIKAGCYFDATIEILEHKELTPELIGQLLNYGRYKGIGQWRNGGYGCFTWEEVRQEGKELTA